VEATGSCSAQESIAIDSSCSASAAQKISNAVFLVGKSYTDGDTADRLVLSF
jgi:hypothetical protein